MPDVCGLRYVAVAVADLESERRFCREVWGLEEAAESGDVVHFAAVGSSEPFESLLLPRPWSRERTVFVGDAAHTTTPQLAMGAALAVEDALVLGEELARASDVPAALAAYEARRFARCQLVVENALQISRFQREGAAPEKAFGVVMTSMAQLAHAY
jgi:2-polyprenyl-6-methoxyphenol hydroxylase-like FAD-dependent oxidoreductase